MNGLRKAVNGNRGEATVVRVDPRTGRQRAVRVDATPFDVIVAFGRVWVTAWEAGKLDAIDPVSLRVVERIDVGPRPTGLMVACGAIWVGFGRDATAIARIDPATGAIERVPVGASAPSWFVAGTPDLWIQANDGDLVRVDPESRRLLATLHVGRTLAQGALAADGTIWAPDKEQSIVDRIDPSGPCWPRTETRHGRMSTAPPTGRGCTPDPNHRDLQASLEGFAGKPGWKPTKERASDEDFE